MRNLTAKAAHIPVVACERGQALILSMFAMVALLGFAAIAIDAGYGYASKSEMQRGSDAAVVAAAQVLMAGGSVSDATDAAKEWAAINGYDDAAPDTSVTVNIPPQFGLHEGDSNFVEVIIEDEVDTFFAKVLGLTAWDIRARAVAGITTYQKPYGIIALNETLCRSVEFNGNISVNIEGGGIFVNSNCPTDALYANGSVSVITDVIDVVGGWQTVGPVTLEPTPSKAGKIADPLAGVPVPVPPAGPAQSCPPGSGPPGNITIQPGVYNCFMNLGGNRTYNFQPGDYLITGGIRVSGSARVNFGAGVYTLRGIGLHLTGTGEIDAEGVTFYIDEGSVDLTGTGDMDLDAPTSGPYAGVMIFQNRQNANQVNARGTAFSDGYGTVYAKAAKIRIVGTADTNNVQFVSDTFIMSGTSGVNIDLDTDFLASAPSMRIVE
jgi:hypothetical protein